MALGRQAWRSLAGSGQCHIIHYVKARRRAGRCRGRGQPPRQGRARPRGRARSPTRTAGDAIGPWPGVASGGRAPGACAVPRQLRAAWPTAMPEPVCRDGRRTPACPPAGAVAVGMMPSSRPPRVAQASPRPTAHAMSNKCPHVLVLRHVSIDIWLNCRLPLRRQHVGEMPLWTRIPINMTEY